MLPYVSDVPVPVVGRFYLVPCVALTGRRSPWPVMGSYHADPDLGFSPAHYHTDVRFLSDRTISLYSDMARYYPSTLTVEQVAMAFVNVTREHPVLYKRRCYRQMPNFPSIRISHILEPQFADFVLDLENPVCPHKGGDLRTAPVDAQGVATCPLHGLNWDMATGRLVPRKTP